jgi:hypothetical protein
MMDESLKQETGDQPDLGVVVIVYVVVFVISYHQINPSQTYNEDRPLN